MMMMTTTIKMKHLSLSLSQHYVLLKINYYNNLQRYKVALEKHTEAPFNGGIACLVICMNNSSLVVDVDAMVGLVWLAIIRFICRLSKCKKLLQKMI